MITTERIVGLIGKAWHQVLTPVNIISGFKKCGIYLLNPGEVTDRQVAPCTLFTSNILPATEPDVQSIDKPCIECNSLHRKRYEEGYDLYGEDYLQWIRDNNLRLPITDSCEVNATLSRITGSSSQPVEISSVSSTHCGGSTGKRNPHHSKAPCSEEEETTSECNN